MSTEYQAAHINFGGINNSKTEFVDFSNPESKKFFQQLQRDFDSLRDEGVPNDLNGYSPRWGFPLQEASVHMFFCKYLFAHGSNGASLSSSPEEFNQMILSASKFMEDNLNPEFIKSLSDPLPVPTTSALAELERERPFNLGNVNITRFINLVLMKDKGIGGLEQIFQDRPSNIGNLNQFLTKLTPGYYVDEEKFRQCLNEFYIKGDGLPTQGFQKIKAFKDVFLKGRKEGPNGSNRNYYRDVENPLNDQNMAGFRSLSNLVMLTYDLISLVLIKNQGKVPSNIPEKPSVEDVTRQKVDVIMNMLRENTDIGVLFLTECIPGCFDTQSELNQMGYNIHYGPESDGLCNAIICLQSLGEMTQVEITQEGYLYQKEFKEIPLHLTNSQGNLHLIGYHANGKGINVERPVLETSFYSWIDGLEGRVIVGCDLNMDFKKHSQELTEAFELGCPSRSGKHGTFTCFKQRTPCQAQWDKAGLFDKKYCDYIITRGIEGDESRVIRPDSNGQVEYLDELEVDADEIVIPNNQFPFEHYGVMRGVDLSIPTEGFSFFGNLSENLAWIDGLLDRFFGY